MIKSFQEQQNNMHNQSQRVIAAEVTLLITMILVAAFANIAPELRDFWMILSGPFVLYGIYFIIKLNK